jgi:hypothetical protein
MVLASQGAPGDFAPYEAPEYLEEELSSFG